MARGGKTPLHHQQTEILNFHRRIAPFSERLLWFRMHAPTDASTHELGDLCDIVQFCDVVVSTIEPRHDREIRGSCTADLLQAFSDLLRAACERQRFDSTGRQKLVMLWI